MLVLAQGLIDFECPPMKFQDFGLKNIKMAFFTNLFCLERRGFAVFVRELDQQDFISICEGIQLLI